MSKRLGPFIVDARELTWPAFSAKHSNHVLVIVPADDDQPGSSDTHECLNDLIAGRPVLNENYRVGILRKRFQGTPFDFFLTVGRSQNNDITLVDIEVSKVHAYLDEDEKGEWTVRDADSTNGTFVNGQLIVPQTKVVIKSMDMLKFSRSISAVFFSPGDFYHFLKSTEAVSALGE